ncbi:MAG: hypothetical protein MN733_23810, partial [Nitrososphaera sp.]|nr:hypothetical protein [Nitrososphaera sp.]
MTVRASYGDGSSATGRLKLDKHEMQSILETIHDYDNPVRKEYLQEIGSKLASALLGPEIRTHFYSVKSRLGG